MSEQTITITLPEAVYERIKTTAQATALTSEEVIEQSLMLLLPALEEDTAPHLRLDLTRFSLLDDMQLWKIANLVMPEPHQRRLEALAELQQQRSLKEDEQAELDTLMDQAQRIMLYKAEARRILAQRGHDIYKLAES